MQCDPAISCSIIKQIQNQHNCGVSHTISLNLLPDHNTLGEVLLETIEALDRIKFSVKQSQLAREAAQSLESALSWMEMQDMFKFIIQQNRCIYLVGIRHSSVPDDAGNGIQEASGRRVNQS